MKLTLMVTVLSASFAAPAFASVEPIAALPLFTAVDTESMFEADTKPMELSALSPQEMKETEGAMFPMAPALAGAALANAHRMTQAGIGIANTASQPGAGNVASFVYNQGATPGPIPHPSQAYGANSIPPVPASSLVNQIPR